jgi:hypothetical protein
MIGILGTRFVKQAQLHSHSAQTHLTIHTSPLSAPAPRNKGTPDLDMNELNCDELIYS